MSQSHPHSAIVSFFIFKNIKYLFCCVEINRNSTYYENDKTSAIVLHTVHRKYFI